MFIIIFTFAVITRQFNKRNSYYLFQKQKTSEAKDDQHGTIYEKYINTLVWAIIEKN